MDTMNSTQAQENFGRLLEKAQREPVQIQRHGRPVAVLLSAEDFELLRKAAKCEGEERERLFLAAAQRVFTESDEVLRRLAEG
jgi:prevent-host-death family protein